MTEPGKMTEIDQLDSLLAQARAAEPQADAGLLARIMADATQTDWDRRIAAQSLRARPQNKGWLAGWLVSMGGWPAVGGLAMATVAGIGIGVAAPDSLSTVTGALWGETVIVALDAQDDVFGLEG